MGIPFKYIQHERQRVYSEGADFDSWKELKKAAKALLKEYDCPNCGGHRCSGENVFFHVRKVDIYRETTKPRLISFLGTKQVDVFVKTAWRVEGLYLKQRDGGWGILSDETEGYIKCGRKDCSWEVRGGVKPEGEGGVEWYSINNVLSGKMFKDAFRG